MRSTSFAILPMLGCSTVFGLDPPRLEDAAIDTSLDGVIAGDADVDSPTFTCGAGYTTISGSVSKYRIGTIGATWSDAEATCESEGAHLFVLSSDAERPGLTIEMDEWIGLSDRVTEGAYRWVTTEVTSFNSSLWAPGEPTGGGLSNCVLVSAFAKELLDADCQSLRAYVCECDGRAADPTSY